MNFLNEIFVICDKMFNKAVFFVIIPAIFRTELDIRRKPNNTFLRLKDWNKEVVFVNGFNIGRYWNIGPQYALYIPTPFRSLAKMIFLNI
jgi:hypothetical protein